MAWSTFVIAGYWAFEPDLSASVRIGLVVADRRRQAGTAFPPCGGKAAAYPVIRELPPGGLRQPGPPTRHAGAPGRRCPARRSALRRLAAPDGGRSGHAATASTRAWSPA